MSKARHDRENLGREEPPLDRSWSLSPGTMLGASVLGVAVLIVLGFINWQATRQIQGSLDQRLGQIETRLSELSTRVDRVATRAPTQTGPDPNRVYTVRTDGAPVRGAKGAPVTIAEFSDFQ